MAMQYKRFTYVSPAAQSLIDFWDDAMCNLPEEEDAFEMLKACTRMIPVTDHPSDTIDRSVDSIHLVTYDSVPYFLVYQPTIEEW
jgi:hypothetical protein